MMLIFSSDLACFERVKKKESFSRLSSNVPMKLKMASVRFHDVLTKEQFYDLLSGGEFGIKRMKTS
jgi:hypothetical protein